MAPSLFGVFDSCPYCSMNNIYEAAAEDGGSYAAEIGWYNAWLWIITLYQDSELITTISIVDI